MVTLALVSGVFLVAADLLDGALKAMHFQAYKSASEQAAQVALQRLVADTTEATSILSVGTTYTLTKIDPSTSLVNRFPTGGASWDPSQYSCQVSYTLTPDGTLTRQITPYVGTTTGLSPGPQAVAFNLYGFSTANVTYCNRGSAPSIDSNVQIALTIQEQDLVRSLNVTVWVPTSEP